MSAELYSVLSAGLHIASRKLCNYVLRLAQGLYCVEYVYWNGIQNITVEKSMLKTCIGQSVWESVFRVLVMSEYRPKLKGKASNWSIKGTIMTKNKKPTYNWVSPITMSLAGCRSWCSTDLQHLWIPVFQGIARFLAIVDWCLISSQKVSIYSFCFILLKLYRHFTSLVPRPHPLRWVGSGDICWSFGPYAIFLFWPFGRLDSGIL